MASRSLARGTGNVQETRGSRPRAVRWVLPVTTETVTKRQELEKKKKVFESHR